MSNICQWCSNTSSTIDSMEYQIEQLKRERDELKAKCAELGESLQGMCDSIVNEEGMYLRKWNSRYRVPTGKALAVMSKEPKTCLAEIEARAVEGAIENFVNVIGMNEVFIHLADLQGYADGLRQQAGGSDDK